MKKKVTKKEVKAVEIICIIDKSGSMEATKTDAIGGYNSFIKEQQKLSGETLFSSLFFNAPVEHKLYHDGVAVKDVSLLDETTYIPSGMTALYDAIGVVIDKVLERHSQMKVAPSTLLMILTDGEENSSREYTSEQAKKKLDDVQKNRNWKVIYVGMSADQFTQQAMHNISSKLGVMNYSAQVNSKSAYRAMTLSSIAHVKDNTDDSDKGGN
jgi:Mg-chelatase subunit ChlD